MRKSFSQWRVVAAVVCMAALSAAGCKSGTWNMPGSTWLAGWTQPASTSVPAAQASSLPSPPSQSASPGAGMAQRGGANPYDQTGLAGQSSYAQSPYSQNGAPSYTGTPSYTGPGAGVGQQLHQSYNNATQIARQQAQGVASSAQNTYNTTAAAARNVYQGGVSSYEQAASAVGGQAGYPQSADRRNSTYSGAPITSSAVRPSPSGQGFAQATANDFQTSPAAYGQQQPTYGQGQTGTTYPSSQYGAPASGGSQYPGPSAYGGSVPAATQPAPSPPAYSPNTPAAYPSTSTGGYAPGSTTANPYVGP